MGTLHALLQSGFLLISPMDICPRIGTSRAGNRRDGGWRMADGQAELLLVGCPGVTRLMSTQLRGCSSGVLRCPAHARAVNSPMGGPSTQMRHNSAASIRASSGQSAPTQLRGHVAV
jgi:hypothetical protein